MTDLPEAIVVSLRDDVARREHVVRHFHAAGIERYGFWPGVPHDDPAVARAYRDGLVAGWPGCFRCGQARCDCANNVLIPQQVANWLAFLGLWRSLPDDADRWFLVCEDDVAFHHGAIGRLRRFLAGFRPTRANVLVRLGQSGLRPFESLPGGDAVATSRVVMSNAAFVINGRMAAHLVRSFGRIATTSDIWLHREMAAGPDVQALTLEPLLATDLSYHKDHAMFVSRIHPKGIDEADRERQARHRMRVDTPEDYAALRRQWEQRGG